MFFDVVDLAVTAVAWNHHHAGTCLPNLIHLLATVVDPFVVIPAGQRASPTATTGLMNFVRIQINPIVHTLIQYPSRLFKEPVSEPFEGPSTIIAWIMIGGTLLEPIAVQGYATRFDVFYEQIEYGDGLKRFESFRIPLLQPIPGCQIGMPSLGPE